MRPKRSAVVPVIALGLATLAAAPAGAQEIPIREVPGLNFYGVTGAIDTPTALSQPDGEVGVTLSSIGGSINRYTLSFQVLPRVQGAFRYSGFLDFDPNGGTDTFDFYDRSFDVTVEVLKERRLLPALKIGLQDFIGTGIQTSEYVVATKTFQDGRLAVSGGIGWGRLGGDNDIGAPFGDRPARDFGRGGTLQLEEAFRGPAAPFGSVIWRPTDRWTLTAEYSSDPYTLETGFEGDSLNRLFARDSPFNFGVAYRFNRAVELGAYSLFGSEVGIRLSVNGNPYRPPVVGSVAPAPKPVAQRAPRAAAPEQWSSRWRAIPDVEAGLIRQLNGELEDLGIAVSALRVVSDSEIEVTYRNRMTTTEATAAGRVARAMSRVLPSGVETFRLIPEARGLRSAALSVTRSDLEALVAAPDREARLLARARFEDAAPSPPGLVRSEEMFPRLTYGIGPYIRRVFFDPDQPLRLELGVRAGAEYEPIPGLILSGTLSKRLLGEAATDDAQATGLPPVRTEYNLYTRESNIALEKLQAAYYFKPGATTYGRVTAGYLERMFGGVSTEILWKPAGSRLGLGAELNYSRKRDYPTDFDFLDYSIVTGHVSAYYELPKGFDVQLDLGRYLAGDVGATLSLKRTFENGWELGAYATVTDASADEFGEGSFDKGIHLKIPLEWFTGRSSNSAFSTTISSITRDGGARLAVDGRLYDLVTDTQRSGLTDQWGSVWR